MLLPKKTPDYMERRMLCLYWLNGKKQGFSQAGVNPKLLRDLAQIAIAFGGRPRLWDGLVNPHSRAWRRRAAEVAGDTSLSEEFRAEVRRFT